MYGENRFYSLQFSLVAMTHTEKRNSCASKRKGKVNYIFLEPACFNFNIHYLAYDWCFSKRHIMVKSIQYCLICIWF